jgi:hypothetical protein
MLPLISAHDLTLRAAFAGGSLVSDHWRALAARQLHSITPMHHMTAEHCAFERAAAFRWPQQRHSLQPPGLARLIESARRARHSDPDAPRGRHCTRDLISAAASRKAVAMLCRPVTALLGHSPKFAPMYNYFSSVGVTHLQ